MTRRSRSVGASAQGQAVCLLALIVCFAVGVLLGSCFARLGGSAGWTQLSDCVQRCMDAERPGLISVLSVTVRYPLLLVLSGLTLWGAWAAPAILMARGFFLGYTVSCFALVYGVGGYALSLTLVLFHGLLLLPLLFWLGLWSMVRTLEKKYRRVQFRFERQEALICAVVWTLVLASSLMETAFLPVLFTWVRGLTGI